MSSVERKPWWSRSPPITYKGCSPTRAVRTANRPRVAPSGSSSRFRNAPVGTAPVAAFSRIEASGDPNFARRAAASAPRVALCGGQDGAAGVDEFQKIELLLTGQSVRRAPVLAGVGG